MASLIYMIGSRSVFTFPYLTPTLFGLQLWNWIFKINKNDIKSRHSKVEFLVSMLKESQTTQKLFDRRNAICNIVSHYNDTTWVSWSRISPAIRSFAYQHVWSNIKEKSEVLHYLPFLMGSHWWPVYSPHKGSLCGKRFHVMTSWHKWPLLLT